MVIRLAALAAITAWAAWAGFWVVTAVVAACLLLDLILLAVSPAAAADAASVWKVAGRCPNCYAPLPAPLGPDGLSRCGECGAAWHTTGDAA